MSTVSTDICNAALIKLAQEPIQDISDKEKNARLCKARYKSIVDFVLRDSIWSFALKRQVLPKKSKSLEYGEANIYDLPKDCVRVVRVGSYPTVDGNKREYYKIEGRELLLFFGNDGSANVMYVSNDVAEESFDASFREAVATKLAIEICYAVTQSTSLKSSLLNEYEQLTLPQSRSINSQEISPDDYTFDTFTKARVAGHGEIYTNPDLI